MGEQHYTVKQVAEKFDMNEETARRWIRKEKLEAKLEQARQCLAVMPIGKIPRNILKREFLKKLIGEKQKG